MCGIAGIWRFKDKVTVEEIRSFTDSMRHRGPDGAGYEVFEDDNLALGHRRLSILDLSEAGKQPMPYADKRYWLTFNGEIYNFIEIRKELISKGFRFISDSDSEVVLAAYIEWGHACFKKFNGMWAIAIWDDKEKTLLLCRDRFGVKPLHYSFIADTFFAFASETVAFKYISGYQRVYNPHNLITAMNAHNVLEPAGATIYKDIDQLLPGSLMIIKHNKIVEEKIWWKTLENLPATPKSFEEQKDVFLQLLSDSCKLRLRSDVPVASALSGGVDSTAVYCMLNFVMQNDPGARVANDWQKAFSIAFPGSKVDERKYIESVLKQTNGSGIIVEPATSDIVNELETSTRLSDFISGTPLACLTYVYKAMHQNGITVSMDGHGVDEYLYGYQSSVQDALTNAYICNNNVYAKTLEETLLGMSFDGEGQKVIDGAKRKSQQIKKNTPKGFGKIRQNVSALVNKKPVFYKTESFIAEEFYKNIPVSSKVYSNVNSVYNTYKNLGEQKLQEEFNYTDLPYNLRDFDRGAMQHQIEIRMPFLDYRLVTYTMALPQTSKLDKGYTKYILRESLKGIMPEDIRLRKLKIGLGSPLADWLNGPLNKYIMDIGSSRKLKETAFINYEFVNKTIQNNCANKTWTDESANRIWPFINYLLLTEN